jgi:hypothetical protein
VTTGDQTHDRSLALREIDVTDQRTTRCLPLRVENVERFTQARSLILRSESTSICESSPASCTRTSRRSIRFTSLTRSETPCAPNRVAIRETSAHVRDSPFLRAVIVFVPATQKKRGHLIRRSHFTEIDGIVINPHETSGGGAHDRFGFAFRDADANAIRQNTSDYRSANPGQTLQMFADLREISTPDSRLTYFASHDIFDFVRGGRDAPRVSTLLI